jgi:hypothetical protein
MGDRLTLEQRRDNLSVHIILTNPVYRYNQTITCVFLFIVYFHIFAHIKVVEIV